MLDPLKHMNVLRLEYYDVIFSIQTLYKAWIFSNCYALAKDSIQYSPCANPQVGTGFEVVKSILE